MIGFYSDIWERQEFLTILNFMNGRKHFLNIRLYKIEFRFQNTYIL